MPTNILSKFGSSTAFTITIASLATSASGVGRQTTMVSNAITRYSRVKVYGKIKQGVSPTGSTSVQIYSLTGDGNGSVHRTDGAGASDDALTILNAQLIAVGVNKVTALTGDLIYFEGWIEEPGDEFGVALVHNTGVNLDATGSNHWLRYVGFSKGEIQ